MLHELLRHRYSGGDLIFDQMQADKLCVTIRSDCVQLLTDHGRLVRNPLKTLEALLVRFHTFSLWGFLSPQIWSHWELTRIIGQGRQEERINLVLTGRTPPQESSSPIIIVANKTITLNPFVQALILNEKYGEVWGLLGMHWESATLPLRKANLNDATRFREKIDELRKKVE